MHHLRSLALFSLVAVCRATAGCNADNCLRALQNTARPALIDCSSYFAHTVTPSTTTLTVTATAYSSTSAVQHTTLTSIQYNEATGTILYTAAETDTATLEVTSTLLLKRSSTAATSTPASVNIPAYASPCSSAARYSSACACAGFVPSTATAPTPSTTITVTQTVPTTVTTRVAIDTTAIIVSTTDTTLITSTVGTLTSIVTTTETDVTTSTTAAAASPSTTFALLGISQDPKPPNSPYVLGYAAGSNFGATLQTAQTFTLTPEGYLLVTGTDAVAVSRNSGAGQSAVSIEDEGQADMFDWTILTCSVGEDLSLACAADAQDLMQFCQDEWYISRDNAVGVCPPLYLEVVYL